MVIEHGGHDFFQFVVNQILKVKNNNLSLIEWQKRIRYFFRQIIFGVYYLHQRGIAHLDLSLENTVINSIDDNNFNNNDPIVRIIDFGLAQVRPNNNSSNSNNNNNNWVYDGYVGKKGYQAPEIRKIRKFKRKKENVPIDYYYNPQSADIWCLGIMLFMMTTGSPPWEAAETKSNTYNYVMKGNLRQLLICWNRQNWVEPLAVGM